MTQVTAKKEYIKDAQGNYIVPYVNPLSDTELGVAKVDGITITASSDGTISAVNNIDTDYVNNSKALETGSVSDNITIYNGIHKYAHSTFDRSKFNVVGSPNITDDGVLSGCSNNSFADIELNISENDDLVITSKLCVTTTLKDFSFIGILASGAHQFFVDVAGSGNILLRYWNGSNIEISNTLTMVTENTDYEITLVRSGSNINLYINGALKATVTNFVYHGTNPINRIRYGYGSFTNTSLGDNKIDLKYSKVNQNGILTFSGNKTGIDTIKLDNYTIGTYGIPVISNDGVLTGGDVTSITSIPVSNLEYEGEIFIGDGYIANSVKQICSICGFSLNINAGVKNIGTNSGNWIGRNCFTYNNTYKFSVKTDGTNITLGWGLKGQDLTYHNFVLSEAVTFNSDISIGHFLAETGNNSKIDLNSFKVYVDGNLVYQPCLKIPYNISKTGSKVVDVYARPRVQDMYEQFGYAPYYTIDETNQNFTLPMGEIYGMIAKMDVEAYTASEIETLWGSI